MLAVALHEVGQFLGGLAAIIGTGKWLVYAISKRNKKEIEEAMASQFFAMIQQNLQRAADQAGPRNTRVIDINFIRDNKLIRIPVIRDTWLTVLPGCDIMGMEFAEAHTVYLLRCENTARIRRHTHEGSESVQVIEGIMRDLSTGTVYKAGETWSIPSREIHSVHFESPPDDSGYGLFMITVTPSLPSSSKVLLQLDGMAQLAG